MELGRDFTTAEGTAPWPTQTDPTLSSLLNPLPGVKEKQLPNHTSFFTGKNIFVFTSRTSNRVRAQASKRKNRRSLRREDITLLTMGKRTMKEWIIIERSKPAYYRKDLALFKEAKAFVEAERKEKANWPYRN
jgi:hypothetical protein